MKSLLPLLAAFTVTAPLQAAVVGYWRFESGNVLADSSGNGNTLSAANSGSTPGSSAVSGAYPTIVAGNANGSVATFDGGDTYFATDNTAFTSLTFTVEAFFTASSIGSTQAIAGHLSGASGNANRSYLFAVSAGGFLQLNYNGSGVAVSTLAVEAGKTYFGAVTVDMTDTSASGITFYIQNLTDSTAMQSVGAIHTGTTLNNSAASFSIGSTASSPTSSLWTGSIDEVRLSNTKLAGSELLLPIPEPTSVALLGLGMGVLGFRRRR